jgi:rubrerythrin
MHQEALHGKWVKELLDARGVKPEKDADSTRRYWNEVLPAVDSFEKATAAAYNAENMRLFRIREIAADIAAPADIRETFQRILPHEEWHEVAFAEMKGNADLTEFHNKGLAALSLVLA